MLIEYCITEKLNLALDCMRYVKGLIGGDSMDLKREHYDKLEKLNRYIQDIDNESGESHHCCYNSSDHMIDEISRCFHDIDSDNVNRDDKIDDLNDQIHSLRAELHDAIDEEDNDVISKSKILHVLSKEIERCNLEIDDNKISEDEGDCYIRAFQTVSRALLGYEFNEHDVKIMGN